MRNTEVSTVWVTPDAEQLIGDMARVSNPDNQGKDAKKLIGYMMRNHHWSPFQMVSLCLSIKTTRTISRQILRHGFDFQEFSGRYAEMPRMEQAELRLQHPTNRQMSIDCENPYALSDSYDKVERHINASYELYQSLLNDGIAKECARNVLPEGLQPTYMYMSGSLRQWLHYLQVRLDANTVQREHVWVAQLVKREVQKHFPVTYDAFEHHITMGAE